ncbi:transglutaminase domain-containing protein [Agathobaculum sp.]|uniref:transglutaminase domain-containing protein n=1 Tax=Agathobaculum sp. TaxID=2048138 RepID=UPI002A80AA04|nr:transglutaminase domain-containing protein [Agathobaculum sp.]MDY3618192.1 transglutaminase domain-containing protein [Agathobaculum sp.]
MKRFFKFLTVAAVLACAGLVVMYPYLRASRVQSPFEAAALLQQELRAGGDEVTFRTQDVELDSVYTALEAIYPYAFSLHSTTRPNGTTTLRVEVSRQSRQKQAREYAGQLAADAVKPGMDAWEKLRALHDTLVRLCEYDSETAESERRSGADAPFAADGALLDHKAVCAGYGRAFAMLCEAAGLRAVYVTSEEMDHGWNAVRLDGTTYFIDCTFDDPVPDRGEYAGSDYFMKTAEELAKTHQWDIPFYEHVLDGLL